MFAVVVVVAAAAAVADAVVVVIVISVATCSFIHLLIDFFLYTLHFFSHSTIFTNH